MVRVVPLFLRLGTDVAERVNDRRRATVSAALNRHLRLQQDHVRVARPQVSKKQDLRLVYPHGHRGI